VSEDYHTASQFQPRQIASPVAPRLRLVPSPVPVDALGSPRIASSCLMCGGGFNDTDLQQLEWPVSDAPAHRDCHLQYVDERNQFSDMLEEMRGA
jgi:hypothetical protein